MGQAAVVRKSMTFGEGGSAAAFVVLALLSVVVSAKAYTPEYGFHALLFAAGSVAAVFAILNRYFDREAAPVPLMIDGRPNYNMGPVKFTAVAAMIWGLAGFTVGIWAALELAFPVLNFDLPWLSFGRIRPLHTSAVIFAFGGNVLIATSFYVVQRTSRARLAGDIAPWFVVLGYNFFIVIAGTGYLLGITQSKEYAEPEWYADLWLTVVWVAYLLVFLGTLMRRTEPHIYVANWFYLAFILTIAVLHLGNNAAIPVSLFSPKSYIVWAGVQDAMVQWWYGHNAVGFFLTAGFLAIMYYFIPKRAERPVYSYRLSIIHFWALIFLYIWAGPHHLHYTALPDWAQTLGMTFSVILWMPSWGGMINGLMSLSGAWDKLRTDPVLRMMVVSVAFYGMATFEGPLMSVKAVNSLSHYTDWTIDVGVGYPAGADVARLHVARLPRILLHRDRRGDAPVLRDPGARRHPVPRRRAADGLEPLANREREAGGGIRRPRPRSRGVKTMSLWSKHAIFEKNSIVLLIGVLVVIAIGGLVEITPLFYLKSTIEKVDGMRPYTPLELAGRNIYVREGCYNCHSQMIRPLRDEVERYGHYSLAAESMYDRPFQWGSKRTGPDLARVGGKYSDEWHRDHMREPKSVVPGTVMPAYPWLATTELDFDHIDDDMRVNAALGVPYSADMIAKARADVRTQATTDAPDAAEFSERYPRAQARDYDGNAGRITEADALIAYLQVLGTLVDFKLYDDKANIR
jgi:cytochrome c oxidase cbb3-type subunit 1